MTTPTAVSLYGASTGKESRVRALLAELKQMTRAMEREDGLLNHAQAALILDISTRRVGELVQLGKLSRFDYLGRTYVSVKEITARREADVKAGRPRRTMGQRITAAAKAFSKYDTVQAVVMAATPEPKKAKRSK